MRRFILFFAISLLFTANIAFAAPVGKVTYVEGKVDVLKPGQTVAAPVSKGDSVDVGDIYRAKSNSKAEIVFVNKNILRIVQNTRTEIKEYNVEGDRSSGVIKLYRGKVQVIGEKEFVKRVAAFAEGNKLEVHTPNAVAGVRGTSFGVSYEGGVTWIFCLEGKVYAFNWANPAVLILIPAGGASNVSGDTPPTQPMGLGKGYFETIVMPWVTQNLEKVTDIWQTGTGPDTTAPVLTLAKRAEPAGSSNLYFTISSDETAALFYSFYRSEETPADWTSYTGTVSLLDVSDDSYTFKYFGIDQAGNVTDVTYLNFDLSQYAYTGVAHNNGSFGMSADVSGNVSAICNQDWGGWRLSLTSGLYESTPSGQFQVVAGGTNAGPTGDGYWLSLINMNASGDVDSGTLSGSLTLTHLTEYTLGTGTGTLTGAYLSSGMSGTWEATAQGGYASTDLTFFSEVDAGLWYHDSFDWYYDGYIYGYMGGVTSLWTASQANPASATIIGEYYPDNIRPHIWNSLIYSYNDYSCSDTTFDGGAYKGFFAGINDSMEGRLVALYIDPSGNAGFLKGSFTGSSYPEIDMFLMSGSIYPTQMATNIGISPDSLSAYIWENDNSDYQKKLSGTFDAGGTILSIDYNSWNWNYSIVNDDTLTAQTWGIYTQSFGGTYDTPKATWSAKLGGEAFFGAYYYDTEGEGLDDDFGYYVMSITNGTWNGNRMAGTATGRFITYTKLGTIEGDWLGTYNSDNTWQAVNIGTWSGTPLKFVSFLYPNLYFYDGSLPYDEGYLDGLMGGTSSLWAATQTEQALFTVMGTVYYDSNPTQIWSTPVYSYNYQYDTKTTYDGGAYYGYIGGTKDAEDNLDGRFRTIYVGPSNQAGYLIGSLTGEYYSGIDMFEMDGSAYPVQIYGSVSGINPGNLYPSLLFNTFGVSGSGTFPSGSIWIDSGYSQMNEAYTPNRELAIWKNVIYGTYSGTTSSIWSLTTYSTNGGYISGTETTGTLWSAGSDYKLAGSTVGYGADIYTAKTWISVGETLGTYNPAYSSFQAVQMGVNLETRKFLEMAGKITGVSSNISALQALNIPCVEIGRTTLTGSNGPITSLTMNDVIFFAPNTGQKPQIWASALGTLNGGGVSGSYSGSPLGTSVALSNGGNISATFIMNQWSGSKWLSTINNGSALTGIGSYSGSFNFNGAGAGTYDASTFSGTAAGVAK